MYQTETNKAHAMARMKSALMSVDTVGGMRDDQTEKSVTFKASDGWEIGGSVYVPQGKNKLAAVVLVHGSRHESDAFGNLTTPGILQTLNQHNIATLRIDIRGRGASRGYRNFCSMSPDERNRVELDVEAAIKFLASQRGVDSRRIGVVAEQDSAAPAIMAGAKNHRVRAFILVSGRLSQSAKEAVLYTSAPLFCLVSKEDLRGFKDMTDAFLASKSDRSRINVFEGLALGTTMFSTWRNEFPDEQPIDETAALWLVEILNGSISRGTFKKRGL
jgi:hypothetical protein